MSSKIQVIHYLNQFFAGRGGEEQAGARPEWLDGPRGPGKLLERVAPDLEVLATVTAGDNFMAESLSSAVDEIVTLIERHAASEPQSRPRLLLAGPAFNAGRYGMACAAVCQAVRARLGIPAVTAMHPDNPAVENYRRDVPIVKAAEDVMGMQEALEVMACVGSKLARGETIDPIQAGLIPRGLRQNYFAATSGADRALDMLMHKLRGEAFVTEYAMPVFDRVPPAAAVKDLRSATVAAVTSGGIVPRGNPDRIESASASKYGAYSLAGLQRLTPDSHQSVHGGYDPTYANADPNRVLPIDALRELEREGRIGRLHDTYYATVGNATSVRRAVRFGEEIAAALVDVGVQAVVFTST
jgi:betaine reductase